MYRGRFPDSDSAYFENLTRCIFQAGLNWRVIESKWSNFQKAFDGFDLNKISSYGDEDVKRLLSDSGIVRNRKKISATIHNAREFKRLAEEHGGFRRWLSGFDKSSNYKKVVKQLQASFKHVGPSTAHIFLYSVGEDIKREE
jgi:DNA-3-methyladenine glycosylase I